MKTSDKNEILGAIVDFADRVEERFNKVEERFKKLEDRFGFIEGRVGKVELGMVTKDYLDRKMAEQHGDIISVINGVDHKTFVLVDTLANKKVLSRQEAKSLKQLKPFPKIPI
jgi:hypothetical protein